jgi:phenylacetate-CoA ligase
MNSNLSAIFVKRPKTVVGMLKNQFRDREQIIDLQNRKLKSIVCYAYEHVAYYRELFRKAGILPNNINSIDDLKKIPVSKKSDLQLTQAKSITSNAFDLGKLHKEHTSGSTGRPFSLYLDDHFVTVRDSLFLRALLTAGYRPGQKLMLVTDSRHKKKNRMLLRWAYASIEQPADKILAFYNQIKPQVLYGCTTALKLMAHEIRSHKTRLHSPKCIISAAEMLDNKTRAFLEDIFAAELFDFYGLTEMGIVGWECPAHNGYHLAEDTVVIEFLPVENDSHLKRLVMTNLHLKSMPFIRYETGDVGLPAQLENCSCGRRLALLEKVEGRIVDCIKLRDGQTISPYRVTCAIEQLKELINYQIIQEDYNQFTVKIQSKSRSNRVKERVVKEILHEVIGSNVRVDVQNETHIAPLPGKKFRVIESRIQ